MVSAYGYSDSDYIWLIALTQKSETFFGGKEPFASPQNRFSIS